MKRIIKKFILIIFALSVTVSTSVPYVTALASEYRESPRRVAAAPASLSEDFDSLFERSSYEYSHDLAGRALDMSLSSFTYGSTDWSDGEEYDPENVIPDSTGVAASRYSRIGAVYSSLGFDEVYYYNYGVTLNDTSDKVAFSVGLKHLDSGDTLVSVIIRGIGYCAEWKSNFNVGHGAPYHVGFYTAAEAVMDKVTGNPDFVLSGDAKFLVSGISRGGAVANVVGAMLDTEAERSEYFDPSDVYTYTFASPVTVGDALRPEDALYSNIHNLINPRDPVPYIIPENLGLSRYGEDRYFKISDVDYLSSDDACARILAINEYLSSEIEDADEAGDFADAIGEIFEMLYTRKKMQSGISEPITPDDFCAVLLDRYGEKYGRAAERAIGDYELIESSGALSDIKSFIGLDDDGIMTVLTVFRLHGISVIRLNSLLTPIVPSVGASDIMNGHYTDVYSAYMSLGESECLGADGVYEVTRLSVLGDADIALVRDGETVCETVGNEIRSRIPAWSASGITNIYLPSLDGAEYSLSVTSDKEVSISITVSEISASLSSYRRAVYSDISLNTGETLSMEFSSSESFSSEKYAVTLDTEDKTSLLNPDILTSGASDKLTVDISSDGEGTVTGAGKYECGDLVTVTAEPHSGSRFIGWYSGNALISDDKAYTFCLTESRNITARFERNERVTPQDDGSSNVDDTGTSPLPVILISVSVTATLAVAVIFILKYIRKNKKEPPVS